MLKVRDFKCQECLHEWEKFTKDGQTQECPKCGSGAVTQQVTSSAFKLTGQGVYDRNMKL